MPRTFIPLLQFTALNFYEIDDISIRINHLSIAQGERDRFERQDGTDYGVVQLGSVHHFRGNVGHRDLHSDMVFLRSHIPKA